MRIIEAKQEDHVALSLLTIGSKSYWNYSKEQIEEWIPVLTITPEYIEQNPVFKLVQNDQIIGYYSYHAHKEGEVLLDNLFISPAFMGKGIGTMLMNDFFDRVQSNGTSAIVLYSDPNAAAFYIKFGFELIGNEPTSIKNRFLPILRKELQ